MKLGRTRKYNRRMRKQDKNNGICDPTRGMLITKTQISGPLTGAMMRLAVDKLKVMSMYNEFATFFRYRSSTGWKSTPTESL